jgi:hypothetical protein
VVRFVTVRPTVRPRRRRLARTQDRRCGLWRPRSPTTRAARQRRRVETGAALNAGGLARLRAGEAALGRRPTGRPRPRAQPQSPRWSASPRHRQDDHERQDKVRADLPRLAEEMPSRPAPAAARDQPTQQTPQPSVLGALAQPPRPSAASGVERRDECESNGRDQRKLRHGRPVKPSLASPVGLCHERPSAARVMVS